MKTGFNIIFIPLFPNNLFELAKYFIHKCRFLKTPPSFPYFVNELKAFATSLGTLSNEKAITVANFFNELSTTKKNLSECFYKGLFIYLFFYIFLLLDIII